MGNFIALFKNYFKEIFLAVMTILIAYVFNELWSDDYSWWIQALLVLGAAVCVYIVAFLVVWYIDTWSKRVDKTTYYIDESFIKSWLFYVLICCIILAIFICCVVANIWLILWTIIAFAGALILGVMFFGAVYEVISGEH